MDRLASRALFLGCSDGLCTRLLAKGWLPPPLLGAPRDDSRSEGRVHTHHMARTTAAVPTTPNMTAAEGGAACAGALLELWNQVHAEVPPANETLVESFTAATGAPPSPPAAILAAAVGILRRRARMLAGPLSSTLLRGACSAWQVSAPELPPHERAPQGASGAPSRPRVGYCSTTDDAPSDCEHADKGSVSKLPDAAACAAFCRRCHRCRFISFSASHSDCSWFHSCRGFDKSEVLGLEFGGETYLTMRIKGDHPPSQ